MLDISCKMNLNNDMEKQPTYEEWTKDMPLTDQIKFHYDVDLEEFFPDGWMVDPWEIVAQVATNPNWLKEFKKEFEENLRERAYIM